MKRGAMVFAAAMLISCPIEAGAEDGAGVKMFKNHCGTCHAIDAAAPARQGPNLHGLFQRRAGTLEGFKYSAGLKAAGWQWTPEQLDLWLTNPKALVPDTFMAAYKQSDPEKRKIIIDYLTANGGN